MMPPEREVSCPKCLVIRPPSARRVPGGKHPMLLFVACFPPNPGVLELWADFGLLPGRSLPGEVVEAEIARMTN